MLAQTLALCERNKDKCNRTDFNLRFLRDAKSRKLTPADEARIALIHKNLTKTGYEVVSEMYAELQTARACPIAGVCNFFNLEEDVFSKWADIQKSTITGIRPIGKPSANGFIREIQLTKIFTQGRYDSHVILKSNLDASSDNLFFEWLVGRYLNGFMKRFPLFCKTYSLYEYSSAEDKALMLERPESALPVIKRLNVVTDAGIQKMVQNPERLCLVVQQVHNAVSMFDLMEEFNLLNQTLKDPTMLDIDVLSRKLKRDPEEVKRLLPVLIAKPLGQRAKEMILLRREIVCALYQIYFVLDLMPGFSHNDLHVGNVILTPAGENKHYEFHYDDKMFQSKYAVKLLDYGRCSFDGSQSIKDKVEAFLREQVLPKGLSKEDEITQIESIQRSNGLPWQYLNPTECSSLDFRLLNISIGYGVLKEGVFRETPNTKGKVVDDSDAFYGKLDVAPLPPNYVGGPCDGLTKFYLESLLHKKRHKQYVDRGVYPTIRSVAPALYTEIEPYEFENSQCFCKIYVRSEGDMRIEWPVAMAAGKKTRRRKKTRSRTKIY